MSESEEQQQLSRAPKEYPSRSGGGKRAEQARCWMLTLNMAHGKQDPKDFDERDTIAIRKFNAAAQVNPCTYCVFQGEVGEHGTYHLQGYAEFEKPMTAMQVRKHFGERVYCEIRAGTQAQAIAYCSKDDETKRSETRTYGEPMKQNARGGTQGSRTDWSEAWTELKKGKRPAEVLDTYPHMLPCVRALHHARTEALSGQFRKQKTVCIVLFGDAGTGKSSTARRLAEAKGEWTKVSTSGNSLWFDHYDPMRHATVILDEFTGSKCKLTMLNELSDESQFYVETKGSTMPWLASQLIITSNYHPKKWYDFENPDKHLDVTSLMRRIDILMEFRLEEVLDGLGARRMLSVIAHKGFLHAKMVSSVWPVRMVRDLEDSVGTTPPGTPTRTSVPSKRQRVTRQLAMDGLESPRKSIPLDEVLESEDE